MARPRKELEQSKLEALCRLNPTLEDTAAFFGVCGDTIDSRCKEWGYKGFSDARRQNMVHTRLHLIRRAVEKAETSDTMHIFSLKNLCNWKDKQESDVNVKMPDIKIVQVDSKDE